MTREIKLLAYNSDICFGVFFGVLDLLFQRMKGETLGMPLMRSSNAVYVVAKMTRQRLYT